MKEFILATLLLIFAYTDIKYLRIPKFIVFSAIIAGVVLTGYFIETITAFVLMSILCQSNLKPQYVPKGFIRFAEGDIKLFTMVASFIGWMFIPSFLATLLSIRIYRFLFNRRHGLPVAPFACVSTIFIITAVAVLQIVWRAVA